MPLTKIEGPSVGIITSSTQLRCSLYNVAAQSIPDSAYTAVTFDSETFDIGNLHSTTVNTSRITIPTAGDGTYLITTMIPFVANATGLRQVVLYKNGSALAGSFATHTPSSAATTTGDMTQFLDLVAGDYIEVFVYQNTGGALNIGNSGNVRQTFMAAKMF